MAIKIIRSIRSISMLIPIFLIIFLPLAQAFDPPTFELTITSKFPIDASLSQQVGITNTFNVTLNRFVTSKWFLDGAEQSVTPPPFTGISYEEYTKTWSLGDAGLHNITYFGMHSLSNETVSTTWMVTVANLVDNAPVTSLVSPIGSILVNTNLISFSCFATDDIGLSNMTLYGSWSGWGAKKTNSMNGRNASATFTETLSEGEYFWNCAAQDSGGNRGFAADNYTVIVNLNMSSPPDVLPDNQTPPEIPLPPAAPRIVLWPNVVKISSGNSIDLEVTVKNTGGVRIDELFLESSNTWLELDKSKFVLDANERKVLSANLSVPLIATPGPYPVTVFLKAQGRTFDDVSIPVLVIEKPGSASTSTIDIDAIRQELEQVKSRMNVLSGQGYDTSAAKEHIGTAESLFGKKEYLNASEQVSLASGALDASESSRETSQTFLKSYVFAGIAVCISIILLYPIYRKHLARKGNPVFNAHVASAGSRLNTVRSEPEDNANIKDMVRRLREIKERVGR